MVSSPKLRWVGIAILGNNMGSAVLEKSCATSIIQIDVISRLISFGNGQKVVACIFESNPFPSRWKHLDDLRLLLHRSV